MLRHRPPFPLRSRRSREAIPQAKKQATSGRIAFDDLTLTAVLYDNKTAAAPNAELMPLVAGHLENSLRKPLTLDVDLRRLAVDLGEIMGRHWEFRAADVFLKTM